MNISQIFRFTTIIVSISINTGCESSDDVNTYSQPTPIAPDTVIYVSTFPTNVGLKLGKSVMIQNAGTTFMFYSLVSDTRHTINNEVAGNAEILLHVDYGSFQKYIALNTHTVPSTYSLENGLLYSIHLKDVQRIDSAYQIIFQFNQYKYW